MTSIAAIPALAEFTAFLETGAPHGIAPDVVFQFTVPGARFEVRGLPDLIRQRSAVSVGRWNVTVGRALPTSAGFAVEIDYQATDPIGQRWLYRTLSLVTVTDRMVTEVVHYCTGPTTPS